MADNYQTNLLPISAFYLTTAERHLPLVLVDATGRPDFTDLFRVSELEREQPSVRVGWLVSPTSGADRSIQMTCHVDRPVTTAYTLWFRAPEHTALMRRIATAGRFLLGVQPEEEVPDLEVWVVDSPYPALSGRHSIGGRCPASDWTRRSEQRFYNDHVDGRPRRRGPKKVSGGTGSEHKTAPVRARHDEPVVLTASEIGSFAYCEEAWLLQRAGVLAMLTVARRLEEGTLAHRGIGRKTDGVRRADWAQRVVLLVVLALALILAVEVFAAQLVH